MFFASLKKTVYFLVPLMAISAWAAFSASAEESAGKTVVGLKPYDPEIASAITNLLSDPNIELRDGVGKNTLHYLLTVVYEFDRNHTFSRDAKPVEKAEEKSKNVFTSIFNTLKSPFSGGGGYVYTIKPQFEFSDFRTFRAPTIRNFDHNQALNIFCHLAAQGIQWAKDNERRNILKLKRGVTVRTMEELESRMYGEGKGKKTIKGFAADERIVSPPKTEMRPQEEKRPQAEIKTGQTFFLLMTDNSAWIVNIEPENKTPQLFRLKDWLTTKDSSLVGPRVAEWIKENDANLEAVYLFENGMVRFDETKRLKIGSLLEAIK
ncbi:MAG: hypothetical protein AB1656_25105 [Candidatus Omnitrophota bacterium]